MTRLRGRTGLLTSVALILLVASVPTWGLTRYYYGLFDQAMIFAIAVMGLYFVLGLTGQLSLAQAAFFGLGAYVSAIMTTRWGLPLWINLPVSVVAAAVLGVLLGIPSLKLSGHYLAMTTIGFGVIIALVFRNWRPVTGGADGIGGIKATRLFGISLAQNDTFFYAVLFWLVVATVVAVRVSRSRLGRAFQAIRENELAAECTGIDSTRFKVVAFTICAAYGGLAGSLWTHWTRYISPDTFEFDTSVKMLAMLVVGGSTGIAGSLIGAGLLTLLPEALRFLHSSYLAVYGAAIILLMIFMPEGIWGMAVYIFKRRTAGAAEAPRMLSQSETPTSDGTAVG